MNEEKMLIQIVNQLIKNASFLTDLGLYHGKMGIVLFIAHYAKYSGEEIYEELAGELLDEICNEIHNEVPVNFESGLCGIGWGIEYLLEKGFMEGDSDEILENIDLIIMREDIKSMKDLSVKTGLNGIFHYVNKRMNSKNRKGKKVPFDIFFLDSFRLLCKEFIVQNDESILSEIIRYTPGNNSFEEWELGLEAGCAGLGLKIISGS